MKYTIQFVRGHYEAYDMQGAFLISGDTYEEILDYFE